METTETTVTVATPTNASTPETSAPPTSATPTTDTPATPQLTDAQKTRAAVNDPADHFILGGRTFKIVDLPYDDYLRFILLMEPLVQMLVQSASQSGKVSIPGMELDTSSISAMGLARYCGDSLPEMVRIICSQTEPEITVEEIKKLGRNPFVLAKIVILQVSQNGIIRDFTDFFAQILPLFKTT